jgi:hypothetical protein
MRISGKKKLPKIGSLAYIAVGRLPYIDFTIYTNSEIAKTSNAVRNFLNSWRAW